MRKIESVTLISVILIITIIIPLTITAIASNITDQSTLTLSVQEEQVLHGFTVTAYCPGRCCNGRWAGMTCTGKKFTYYTDRGIRIAAVDPEIIPLGTCFSYRGEEYIAADTGSAIRKKRIDILLPTHHETEEFGIKHDQDIIITR